MALLRARQSWCGQQGTRKHGRVLKLGGLARRCGLRAACRSLDELGTLLEAGCAEGEPVRKSRHALQCKNWVHGDAPMQGCGETTKLLDPEGLAGLIARGSQAQHALHRSQQAPPAAGGLRRARLVVGRKDAGSPAMLASRAAWGCNCRGGSGWSVATLAGRRAVHAEPAGQPLSGAPKSIPQLRVGNVLASLPIGAVGACRGAAAAARSALTAGPAPAAHVSEAHAAAQLLPPGRVCDTGWGRAAHGL